MFQRRLGGDRRNTLEKKGIQKCEALILEVIEKNVDEGREFFLLICTGTAGYIISRSLDLRPCKST